MILSTWICYAETGVPFLAQAHQAYGVKDAKVVFVVNEDLRNFADWCQVGKKLGYHWEKL